MSRKAFRHLNGARFAKSLLLQRGAERKNTSLPVSHRDGPDHGPKHQPWRRLILLRGCGPAKPPATDQAAVDADRVRPVDRHLLVRRRIGAQSVGQRHHCGVEGAARGAQCFVRFEHNRKLREVKAADIDQRTGAARYRDLNRVGEGVTAFAQPHQGKRRRQIDPFREMRVGAWGRRQMTLQLPFRFYWE